LDPCSLDEGNQGRLYLLTVINTVCTPSRADAFGKNRELLLVMVRRVPAEIPEFIADENYGTLVVRRETNIVFGCRRLMIQGALLPPQIVPLPLIHGIGSIRVPRISIVLAPWGYVVDACDVDELLAQALCSEAEDPISTPSSCPNLWLADRQGQDIAKSARCAAAIVHDLVEEKPRHTDLHCERCTTF